MDKAPEGVLFRFRACATPSTGQSLAVVIQGQRAGEGDRADLGDRMGCQHDHHMQLADAALSCLARSSKPASPKVARETTVPPLRIAP